LSQKKKRKEGRNEGREEGRKYIRTNKEGGVGAHIKHMCIQ
jgi:hypothetical protein